jgi:hypothetical protein
MLKIQTAYFEHRRKRSEQFKGMLMADNKTDPYQWTSEKPTESGFYYYRQSNDEEPIVLKVEVQDEWKGLTSVVWLPGDNAAEPLEQCHGDRAGPDRAAGMTTLHKGQRFTESLGQSLAR